MKRTRAETLNLESIFTTGVNLHSQGGGRHPSLTKQLTYFYENFKNCKKKNQKFLVFSKESLNAFYCILTDPKLIV